MGSHYLNVCTVFSQFKIIGRKLLVAVREEDEVVAEEVLQTRHLKRRTGLV